MDLTVVFAYVWLAEIACAALLPFGIIFLSKTDKREYRWACVFAGVFLALTVHIFGTMWVMMPPKPTRRPAAVGVVDPGGLAQSREAS